MKVTMLITPPDLPEVGQAAALGLSVLRFARVERWKQLDQVLPAGLSLDDGQREILERHAGVLGLLRAPVKIARTSQQTPTVTLEVCLTCGRWIVAASKASPAGHSCRVSIGCLGPTKRATPAARVDALAHEAAPPPLGQAVQRMQVVESQPRATPEVPTEGAGPQLHLFEDPPASEPAPGVGA